MIYDAFAHLPLFGLGDLGFMPHEETGQFIADRITAIGGKLPMNTNGGGLSYMHSGMYGMYALQESVRQMRGIAPAQVPDAKISSLPRRRRHVRREWHDHFHQRTLTATRNGRETKWRTTNHWTAKLSSCAGRGIGREIALLAAAEGAKVVVNDPGVAADGSGTNAAPAEEVVEEIKKRGGTAVRQFRVGGGSCPRQQDHPAGGRHLWPPRTAW